MALKFRAGQQLVSAVDSTAVIVIKAPAAEGTVTNVAPAITMARPSSAGRGDAITDYDAGGTRSVR